MSELKSGIYKITINDYYIYIGQSVDIKCRWSNHLSKLKQNKHHNKKLQNVFNKYSDSIKFQIIEECSVDELDEREIFYIQQFKSYNTNYILNMSVGGDCKWRKYATKEEAEAARKQWYIDHKEKSRQYNTQYYQNNRNYFKYYCRQKGILSKKEKFEKRYNLSRPLTNKEWDTWRNTKNNQKPYAIKFLQSLPNITFTLPTKS